MGSVLSRWFGGAASSPVDSGAAAGLSDDRDAAAAPPASPACVTDAARPPMRFFAPPASGPDVTVVLVRHGQRIDHIDSMWYRGLPDGTPADPPLSSRGRDQAIECGVTWHRKMNSRGAKAASTAVTCIVTSPLKRCLETSAAIAERVHAPLFVHAGLVDAFFRKLHKHGAPRMRWLQRADGGHYPPVWPFKAGSKAADPRVLPDFPELPATFGERCCAAVLELVAGLEEHARRCEAANVVAPGQVRLPSEPVVGGDVTAAAAPQGGTQTRRGLRLVLVTHADVIAEVLAGLCPKDRRSDRGQPSVPYASATTITRRNGEWTLEQRGGVDAIPRTVVRVRH